MNIAKRFFIFSLLLLISCCLQFPLLASAAPSITVLKSLGSGSDGANPYSNPVVSGGKVYGAAYEGGGSNNGTMFSVDTDGTDFTVLHDFNGAAGTKPSGTIIVDGTKIYGTTENGGATGVGTIFSLNTDGTGFTLLHEFNYDDGADPYDSLALSGTKLYGVAHDGGTSGVGVLFSINTNGTGYTILRNFSNLVTDAKNPRAAVIVSGTKIYGTSNGGGANGLGTVFSINTDGTGFTILHSFSNATSDAKNIRSGLILSGANLYGATYGGGANNLGTVYSLNTDGTGFTLLHSFSNSASDGQNSHAPLTISGNILFGTTEGGGANGAGALFGIKTDGTNFAVLHSFSTSASDGNYPGGSVYLSGSTLYGLTYFGGANANGAVYSFGPVSVTAPAFSAGPSDGGSSTTTPTSSGDNVRFTATATDAEADNYYLAICKTDAITTNSSAAPTCTGGSWCASASTAQATEATCSYTTSDSDNGSHAWFAFVCDDSGVPLCSASNQGAGITGSPFVVVQGGKSDASSEVRNQTAYIAPPTPPFGGFAVSINNGASETTSQDVTLALSSGADTLLMSISNYPDFKDSYQENYSMYKKWNLLPGNGLKTVYARFYTGHYIPSPDVSANITLKMPGATTTPITTTITPSTTTPSNTTNTATLGNISYIKTRIAELLNLINQLRSQLNANTSNSGISSSLSLNPPSIKFNNDILAINQTHPDVKSLQQFLNSNNYTISLVGPGSPGHETNTFGPLTKSALSRFQEIYSSKILAPLGHIKATGLLGPSTREFINGLWK